MAPTARWLQWDAAGLFSFRPEGGPVSAWPRADASIADLRECFAHEVQPIVLQSLGWEAMHASASLTPAGAVALCGASGSGKSTLAYALARKGCSQLSDDHLVIGFNGDRPVVHPLPFQRHLRPASIAHLGDDAAGQFDDDRPSAAVPLAAVVLVEQVADEAFSILPVPAARAFSELLPHAHAFDPHDPVETRRLVTHYLTLVDSVPVYRLRYPPSFSNLDRLVQTLRTLTVGG